jgi:hypothetical protein
MAVRPSRFRSRTVQSVRRTCKVEIVQDAGVFVNTGRLFFEGFDYLYDAAGGYVGYGWNGRLSGDNGAVTPGIAQ